MALSRRALLSLETAVVSTVVAEEIDAALDSPQPLSDLAKESIEIAMAQFPNFNELIASIEGTLGRPLSDAVRANVRIALADNADGDELSDLADANN